MTSSWPVPMRLVTTGARLHRSKEDVPVGRAEINVPDIAGIRFEEITVPPGELLAATSVRAKIPLPPFPPRLPLLQAI